MEAMQVARKAISRVKRLFVKDKPYEFIRNSSKHPDTEQARDDCRVLNLIEYTKTNQSSYSAKEYESGYHEVVIGGRVLAGQRSPAKRLSALSLDFKGKSVLDIGCNQGGMLLHIADQLKWGIGLDYDGKMVNLCNLQKSVRKISNVDFYVFDIDADPHELILDLLPESKVDVIFLLSVCMWVEKWRSLIDFCATVSDVIVFETNGTDAQQSEQIDHLATRFPNIRQITAASEDDPKQKKRRLYIASR
jgi:SAM-dependent methyltransferase